MIVFDLACRSAGHRFEGWFSSSDDFASQQQRGLITCPHCGSGDVVKAPMAPSVPRKGNQVARVVEQQSSHTDVPVAVNAAMPPEAIKMMKALAKMQAEAIKNSRNAGTAFVEEARSMHYGEREAEQIHGQATLK
jgi:hypothetical protein